MGYKQGVACGASVTLLIGSAVLLGLYVACSSFSCHALEYSYLSPVWTGVLLMGTAFLGIFMSTTKSEKGCGGLFMFLSILGILSTLACAGITLYAFFGEIGAFASFSITYRPPSVEGLNAATLAPNAYSQANDYPVVRPTLWLCMMGLAFALSIVTCVTSCQYCCCCQEYANEQRILVVTEGPNIFLENTNTVVNAQQQPRTIFLNTMPQPGGPRYIQNPYPLAPGQAFPGSPMAGQQPVAYQPPPPYAAAVATAPSYPPQPSTSYPPQPAPWAVPPQQPQASPPQPPQAPFLQQPQARAPPPQQPQASPPQQPQARAPPPQQPQASPPQQPQAPLPQPPQALSLQQPQANAPPPQQPQAPPPQKQQAPPASASQTHPQAPRPSGSQPGRNQTTGGQPVPSYSTLINDSSGPSASVYQPLIQETRQGASSADVEHTYYEENPQPTDEDNYSHAYTYIDAGPTAPNLDSTVHRSNYGPQPTPDDGTDGESAAQQRDNQLYACVGQPSDEYDDTVVDPNPSAATAAGSTDYVNSGIGKRSKAPKLQK